MISLAVLGTMAPIGSAHASTLTLPDSDLLRVVRLEPFGGGAQPGLQRIDALQELQRQSDAGQVDAEVSLQTVRLLHAHNARRRKAPLRTARLERLQHALLDELQHPFCLHAARARQ